MNKKFWLTILILFAILAGILYWYFNYYSVETSTPESSEEKMEREDRNFQTIELEKPPFITP